MSPASIQTTFGHSFIVYEDYPHHQFLSNSLYLPPASIQRNILDCFHLNTDFNLKFTLHPGNDDQPQPVSFPPSYPPHPPHHTHLSLLPKTTSHAPTAPPPPPSHSLSSSPHHRLNTPFPSLPLDLALPHLRLHLPPRRNPPLPRRRPLLLLPPLSTSISRLTSKLKLNATKIPRRSAKRAEV